MVLDFETAWCRKTGYTLSEMTTEEYVRDPRFKAWGVSYKWYGRGEAIWIPGFHLQQFFDSIDWSKTAVLAHNALFDVSILSWIYGHVPCFIMDSLSMARALRGVEQGNSLAKLADAFGLAPKDKTALVSTDGMLDKLPLDVERALAEYCCHDVELCEQIFNCLRAGFSSRGDAVKVYTGPDPASELRLIDMTLRMYVAPKLVLDGTMLEEAIGEEQVRRVGLLKRLATMPEFGGGTLPIEDVETRLASNEQFSIALQALGVTDVPTKKSKTTGKIAFAFAKTDALFQALLNGDNEDVSLLCEARLRVKSTLERTRGQRLLDISKRGTLPIPLRYYAAHTGRWGGAEGINMQNLRRGSALRKAIMAPAGYEVGVCDLSQIEPRVLAWLADYSELLNIFRSGKDAYAMFGAQMFGIPGMTKDSHPELRQSAKSALLGAGYGLGFVAFAAQLLTGFLGAPPIRYDKTFAKQVGVTQAVLGGLLDNEFHVQRMAEIPHTCTWEELVVHCAAAKRIIDIYRAAAEPIAGRDGFWSMCHEQIESAIYGGRSYEYKHLTFEAGGITLPNGMKLQYSNLRFAKDNRGRAQWMYGPNDKKIYGGKVCENIVQAVARIVMTDGMLRIQKRYPVVLTVHDEAVALLPEKEAEEGLQWMKEQMTIEPKWMPGIPLDASVGHGKRYGEAK